GFAAAAIRRHWAGVVLRPADPMRRAFGLSGGQEAAWTRLEGPFLADLARNWEDIRAHRQALLDELFAAQPDTARLAGIQAGIAALQDEQQKRVIRQLLAERDVLDDRQRALLKDLLMQEFAVQATQAEQLHRQVPAVR